MIALTRVSFCCVVALAAACWSMAAEDPKEREAGEDFAAVVEQRVRDWQPTKGERLLDQIGWASDLVEARRLAKKHDRPLFVFTYNGSTTRAGAIALQRC